MFALETQDLSPDDYERIANHLAYLAVVSSNDPQRAAILSDLLTTTYKYAGIAAADILLSTDYELHMPVHLTA
jgi:hypothetical protein